MSVNETILRLSDDDRTTRGAGFPSVLDSPEWPSSRRTNARARSVRCLRWHCPNPQAHNLAPPSDWSRAGQAAFLLLIGFLLCWLAFAAGVL